MPLIEVLKWDASPKVFAYKYPNCELNTKSQLVVSESQEAVLVKEGQFHGPFGPGRHVLDTKNFPFLTTFVTRLVSGGDSPYTAEVWFTNKAIPLDIKWGTMDPIQVEDPKYHVMLPVRAFGQYGVQIVNSQKFLAKLVGRVPVFVEKTLSDYFRGIIIMRAKDCIASYLVDQGVSVLHISSKLNDISEFLQGKLTEVVDEYGLKIISFTVNSITTDERDPAVEQLKKALAKKAEMDIMGFTYEQEKSFDVMGKAASNTGSGVGATMMNAGMGLGMGFGLGGPMGAMAGTMAQNLQTASQKKCLKCGAAMAGEARFCPSCGTDTCQPSMSAVKMVRCDKCGHETSLGMKFCPNCGDVFNRCPHCDADNPEGTRICRECGKPFPQNCSACGAKVPDGVKFCSECGYKMVRECTCCHKEVPPSMKFCPECGTKVEA